MEFYVNTDKRNRIQTFTGAFVDIQTVCISAMINNNTYYKTVKIRSLENLYKYSHEKLTSGAKANNSRCKKSGLNNNAANIESLLTFHF